MGGLPRERGGAQQGGVLDQEVAPWGMLSWLPGDPSGSLTPGAGQKRGPLAIAFALYLSTPLARGSLLSGGRAEGEAEEGWGGTGTLLHRRWTVFLSSLPKGKEKASGGYSQGGSDSLFFHPAGERILPSALCSPAPQASRVTRCLLWPQTLRTGWL